MGRSESTAGGPGSAELLSAGQMKAIETAAMDRGEVTGLELMERAGQGVVEAIFSEWPEMQAAPHRAVVLCGPGNNGGDGFVVARLLHQWRWQVEVHLCGDPAKLPPDARTNYERWCALGEVTAYCDTGEGAFWLDPADWGPEDLIVDALFGTGLIRPAEAFDAFGWATQVAGPLPAGPTGATRDYPAARVVAIDIPSGLCADSGRYLRSDQVPARHEDIRAHLTVSFHAEKLGHRLADGPAACGKVVVADIGLRHAPGPEVARLVGPPEASAVLKRAGHKYGHGHALVLAGGLGRTGAARLAARAALRVGAGLVTVGAPGPAMMECAGQLTAIMLRRCDGADGVAALLQDARLNAVCLGPGLGVGEATRGIVAAVLAAGRATVLDADALTSFAEAPEALAAALHDRAVLTPHDGEFARIFPDLAEQLAAPATSGPAFSRLDAARAAAARTGATVLLKGPDTVIAAPDGRGAVHSAAYGRAAPWLATAGAGDVLAGLVAGLMARGLPPVEAASAAAWLHVEAARAVGPGLIAEDLPDRVPRVLAGLAGSGALA